MFEGSLVALVTPFRNDKIDEDAIRKMVHWHIEQGTDGIVPMGTTGESATLNVEEHTRVTKMVVEEAVGRIPIIAGAGSNDTRSAIHNNDRAQDLGADAALHVAGYYNRPSQEGLYRHFEAVHAASRIPIIVYNIPARVIVDIQPETMARIAALPRVAGVKDATGDLNRPILEGLLIEKEFSFLSGDDGTAVAYNVAGGNGCISVTANIAPALVRADAGSVRGRGFRGCCRYPEKTDATAHGSCLSSPVRPASNTPPHCLGLCDEFCRLPIVPLSDGAKSTIREAMTGLGLI